jgi:hypothetical protein
MTTPQPKAQSRFGRAIRILVAFAAMVTGLVVLNASPAQALLPPEEGCPLTTTPGSYVYRCEIMYRAQTWYEIRNDSDMTYSQTSTHWDWSITRKYRRDCSGYVDMAWHLNSDQNTSALPGISTQLGSWKDLQPGDILDYPGVHTILFKAWNDGAHTSFTYYAFGGTPVKIATETITGGSDGKIDTHSYSGYKPYRYNKVR